MAIKTAARRRFTGDYSSRTVALRGSQPLLQRCGLLHRGDRQGVLLHELQQRAPQLDDE